ncbi:YjaG family protein [Thalassotalea ganghwensis]
MAINLPFSKLSIWQRTAFCAALLERMLPNYQMFSQAADFGDFNVLRNQLDLVWQRLDKSQKIKINYDAQLAKLEDQTPEPEDFDFFGVYPALDTCMALMSLFQNLQYSEDNEGFIAVSRLSYNSVSFYIELLISQELAESELVEPAMIEQHPLMVWEKEMQNALFDFAKEAIENKATCLQLKKLALMENLSNLGIEF